MIQYSFKWKLFYLFAGILLIAVFLFSFIINKYEKATLLQLSKEKGNVISNTINQNLLNMMDSGIKLQLYDFLSRKITNEIEGISIIDLSKGKILYSNEKDLEGQLLNKNFIDSLKDIPSNGNLVVDNLKEKKILYFSYLGNDFFEQKGRFVLKVKYTNKRVFAFIKKQIKQTIFLSIFILIFGLLITLYFGRLITKPINSLIRGTFELGNGNIDYRISISSKDEFGKLANSFNEMAEKLKYAQKQMIVKELMDRDLKLGQEIQSSLFLKDIPKNKYDIATHYEFARTIGGDYYDILKKPGDDKISCVVADVSGKGIPGSLIMVMIRSILRAQYIERKDLKTLIKAVNHLLMEDIIAGKFVTLLITTFNERDDTFETLNAGHLPLYRYNAKTNNVDEINPNGIGIGLNDGVIFDSNIEVKSGNSGKGDVFLFCTDGVTEAMNPSNEEYGEERLKELLKKNAGYDSKTIIKNIREEIVKFLDGAELQDDFTMVILKNKEV
ncbi:SpoIIE family protein phosphatase [bacterium]|nr:SpoIIE family protein phosphatase [bacterium]